MTIRISTVAALFLLSTVTSLVACEDDSTPNAPNNDNKDASTLDAADNLDASTDGGADLFASDTTKIVMTSKGGLVASPPDGSTCSPVDKTFTLSLPSFELSSSVCEAAEDGLYELKTGTKTIASANRVKLTNALHALKRATEVKCGADKPNDTIVFTTPKGDATYYDDFYFCNANDTKAYVTGLDAVRQEFEDLAK